MQESYATVLQCWGVPHSAAKGMSGPAQGSTIKYGHRLKDHWSASHLRHQHQMLLLVRDHSCDQWFQRQRHLSGTKRLGIKEHIVIHRTASSTS